MSSSKQALRSRIRSIRSTKKITSAMEMISNVKLFRQRQKMEKNRIYSAKLKSIVSEIIAKNSQIESSFQIKNKKEDEVVFVMCSDLGLAGAYNANILKKLKEEVKSISEIVVIGTKLRSLIQSNGFKVANESISSDMIDFNYLQKLLAKYIHLFQLGKIGKISILYTRFINTMNFEPTLETLLPLNVSHQKEIQEHVETLFEPNAQELLDTVIPMMLNSILYAHWLESATAEQGSRRVAMKTATDNANELAEQLQLEYNKLRQATITQEITEIVSGANVAK